MKKSLLMLVAIVAIVSCRKEEPVVALSEYESSDVQARTYNFQIYPGSKFLNAQTELLRKAHFVLQPEAKEAPPMALYDTDAPLDEVGKFYTGKYEYPPVAESQVNNFSPVKPAAYYIKGDLAADAQAVLPILQKLNLNPDLSKAVGEYRGVHISPKINFPRVTLQRPYFDLVNGVVVDRTQIVMVKE